MLDEKMIEGLSPVGRNKRKKQIILTNTCRDLKDYILSLKFRYNGKNKMLPHYVVTREGEILNIIPPDTYSSFLNDRLQNKQSIIISLENLGWLRKNPLNKGYLNWIGNVYNGEVYDRKWRGYNFWHPYTEKQTEVLNELISVLCEDFNIPKNFIGHNVKVDGIQRYNGIVSLSNYDNKSTSLNPAFDFDIFINKSGDE